MTRRWPSIAVAVVLLSAVVGLASIAPAHGSAPDPQHALLGPFATPILGTDLRGRPIWEAVACTCRIVLAPAMAASLLVMGSAMAAGLLRAAGFGVVDRAIAMGLALVGALPRWVVLLGVALLLPAQDRGLMPLAMAWACLVAPGAMDEAAAVAERIGGARFVEALKAHGFGAWRIFGLHVGARNLRPVVVRQGAEVLTQVVFVELSMGVLTAMHEQPSFTHPDDQLGVSDLLHEGYTSIVLDLPTGSALVVALMFVWAFAMLSASLRWSARAR